MSEKLKYFNSSIVLEGEASTPKKIIIQANRLAAIGINLPPGELIAMSAQLFEARRSHSAPKVETNSSLKQARFK